MSKPTAPLLRVHPRTGARIEPLGYRRDGRAIWPIMGAAPDAPPAGADGGASTAPPAAPPAPPASQPPAGGAPTPPAGEAAPDLSKLTADDLKAHPSFQTEVNRIVGERITREQQKWQEKLEEEKRRAGLDDAGKLQAQVEDERKAADAARRERAEAFGLVARTKAEVLAIAEGGRADRTAAIVAQADLTGAVDEAGVVSEAVIRSAVQKVLEAYPEWKAQAATPGRSGTELPPGGGTEPTFTKSQIEAMSPSERVERWAEIEKAMTDGRIDYAR